ncbi:MAG: sialate O-acetylesterase [Mangrovibacterium sp.]
MKRIFLSLCMLIISLVQTPGQVESGNPQSKLQLYLLIGQSNMAGRGVLEAQDTIAPERVLTLSKDLEWVPAKDPIHFDKSIAGTSLGRTFGIEMAKTDKDAVIGLIPCAVGGTPIDAWTPGAFDPNTRTHPWDDMVTRVQFALQYGEIKGILWHQGEGDCGSEKSIVYEEKLTSLIGRLRQLTGDPHTPFVCGELGRFFIVRHRKEDSKSGPADRVVEALRTVSRHDRFAACVSSKGLTDKGDGTHFDSRSLREFGQRYARAMKKIQKKM